MGHRRRATIWALPLVLVACTSNPASSPPPASAPAPSAAASASAEPASPSANDALYQAAKDEGGELLVYTDTPLESMQLIVDAFAAKYPDLDTQIFRADSSGLIERLETEFAANVDTADVFFTSERRTYPLWDGGLIAPYVSPEAETLAPEFRDAEGRWAYFQQSLLSQSWNTECVPAGEEPAEYEDLLDPKWKGKLGLQDPLQGGGVTSWINTMYYEWGEEKWTDFMTRLVAQEPIYGTAEIVADSLAGGETCVQLAANTSFAQANKDDGAPVEWGTPTPMVSNLFSVNLHSKAQHPSAAKLFIDYFLSNEGQEVWAQTGAIPVRPDIDTPHARAFDAEIVPNPVLQIAEDQDFFDQKIQEFFGG